MKSSSQEKVDALLARITGSFEEEWPAVCELKRRLGHELVPLLADLYSKARRAAVRESCVYHSMGYAEEGSLPAVDLGVRALGDRSKHVRYRACMLLAVAQNQDALPALRDAVARHNASEEDFLAAIDAIESRNRHYFVDRDHSGMVTLHFTNLSDAADTPAGQDGDE